MDNQPKTLHVTIGAGASQPKSGAGKAQKQNRQGQVARNGAVCPMLPIDTLSRLLSERNIILLKMIKSAQPKSVAELARLSGRPKASLTLTLRRLEQFGIVVFESTNGRRKIPTVACDRLMLEVPIGP